jgi:glycosyltransferase involved in cell wall biosynthesis
VGEFVEAARQLADSGARFVLVGAAEDDNPAAISRAEVERWVREGVVEWWGHQADMAATLAQASIVCLPSYREGLPKALLEAMAATRCSAAITATAGQRVCAGRYRGCRCHFGGP